jgi:recombination protein RecA
MPKLPPETPDTSSTKGTEPMALDTKERGRAIDLALAQIEKQFGKGSIMKLGAKDFQQEVPVISTTSLSIDSALGIGGVPRGRVMEIFGPESSGKTTLALHIVAQAQRQGGLAAFVDAEHALDPDYARKLGVDVDNLLVSQPDSGEQALEITEVLVRSGALDVLVIDSVAALVPKAELEGEMGDSHVGLQARLMSQALRKLTGVVSRSRTCLIFINQIREKIGIMFGNPETTTGGRALKFYASVRIDIRRIGQIKEGDQDIGSRTRVKIVKNKMAPPFKLAEFDILYGSGISRTGDLLDLAITHRIIEKSGAWFSYGETRLGQGRENVRQFLDQNPDLKDEIELKLRRLLGLIKEPKPEARPADSKTAEAKLDGKEGKEAARASSTKEGPAREPGGRDAGAPRPRDPSPAPRP